MLDQKNSKKQGDVGIGAAIGWFTTQGWIVSIPLTDSQEYDLIVDDGTSLKKVQVKTTRFKSLCRGKQGPFVVALRTTNANTSRKKIKHMNWDKIDYLFVLTNDGNKYLIPSSKINNTNSINLGHKMDQFLV